MKTVGKKLFSLLLVMVLLLSAVPFQAFANGADEIDFDEDLIEAYGEDDGSVHNFSAWHATSDGSKHYRVCKNLVCNGIFPREVEVEAHNAATREENVVEATCAAAGSKDVVTYCTVCAHVISRENDVPVEKTENHTWGEWTQTKAPTAYEKGSEKRTCSVCTKEETREIEALGETYELDFEVYHGYDLVKDKFFKSVAKDSTISIEDIVRAVYAGPAGGYTIDEVRGPNNSVVNKASYKVESGASFRVYVKYNNENNVDSRKVILNAVANGGKVNSADAIEMAALYNHELGSMPGASEVVKEGYAFDGWYTEITGGSRITSGTKYTWSTEAVTLYAHFSQKTKQVNIFGVKGDTKETMSLYNKVAVPEDANLLDWLNENYGKTGLIQAKVPSGYKWDGVTVNSQVGLWYKYSSLSDTLAPQQTVTENMSVYVKFVPLGYTIHFNANGGSVSKDSMAATFNKKVGDLPIPTLDGQVFLGWFDAEGNKWTSNSIFNVGHDLYLTAHWDKEAIVLLHIFLNGNTDAVARDVVLDSYIVGNQVTRETVETIVKKYYSAQSGKTLSLNGIFTASEWKDYVKNTKKEGDVTVVVDTTVRNDLYVMVNNAKDGATTSKPTDTSLPKTGDNTMIFAAASVMTLAAAALVTVQVLRKKKVL